jgi:DNA-binding transcriptional LysR family regulator
MRNVTFRQLQIFVEAAEGQSFVRAAERLRISPAAISFQIKQIESMSGFALFERTGRTVVLSDAGTALLGYARTVLQALHDADQSLTALRGATGGRITIGLISTAKYIVPHILARFQAESPGISIHLRDGNRSEITEALERGEIELAVTGRPPDGTDLTAEVFAPHPTVLVAPPGHKLAEDGLHPPAALRGERFIVREDGSGTRKLMEQYFRDAGLPLRIAMTSSSNETIKQAVMAGMGMAMLSRHTVGLELALGLMRVVPVEGLPLMRSWFVAHRRTMPLLPVHSRLRSFLLTHGQRVIEDLEDGYRAAFAPLTGARAAATLAALP